MNTKPESYPAIFILFTLLSAIRRGIERKNIWCEFRRQKIVLKPRLAFWISVCREAGLVREVSGTEFQVSSSTLRVTSYARAWLNKTPEEQMFHLIESWQNTPKNRKVRMFRKKLLWRLKYNQLLMQKDIHALNGLEAFGLVADGKLTRWGMFFIRGEGTLPTPKAVEPCLLQEDHFLVPFPQHLDLAWDLETLLRPKAPSVYPLTKRALQFYDGDPYALIELVERGLGKPIPEQTRALILKQPSIRIADGIVLEFSSPAELKQLRRQPVFRKYIDEFLSSQRILVSHEKAKGLFQMLTRRGVYVDRNEEQERGGKKRTHFPANPKMLLEPVGKSAPLLTILEKYKELGQALDILYRAPGYAAEQRRITPLLIEERGGQTYVIAYCQTRRGQRTFRLDRMEVPGTW